MQPVDNSITSPPSPPGLPWDATREGPVGPWQECPNSGRLNERWQVVEDFPDSGVWKQT